MCNIYNWDTVTEKSREYIASKCKMMLVLRLEWFTVKWKHSTSKSQWLSKNYLRLHRQNMLCNKELLVCHPYKQQVRKWARTPTEAGAFFELFYRKAAPLHAVPIGMTGFSEYCDKDVLLENGKSGHRKIFSGSHYRHGFPHKSRVSSFPYNISNLAGALYAKVWWGRTLL